MTCCPQCHNQKPCFSKERCPWHCLDHEKSEAITCKGDFIINLDGEDNDVAAAHIQSMLEKTNKYADKGEGYGLVIAQIRPLIFLHGKVDGIHINYRLLNHNTAKKVQKIILEADHDL